MTHSLFGQCSGISWVRYCLKWLVPVLAACVNAWAMSQPALAVGSFQTLLVSNSLMVAARLVPSANTVSRYVLAEVRLAEPALEGLRLESEWLVVVDCDAGTKQLAIVRHLRNVSSVNEPAKWVEGTKPQNLPPPLEWGGLQFQQVMPASGQVGQRLQLPGAWPVVTEYTCSLAERTARKVSVPVTTEGMVLTWTPVLEKEASTFASQVSMTAGLPDLINFRCPLFDRSGRRAGELEMAFSPSVGALRVNDKWVSDGMLDERYWGFELDSLAFRFMRDTGVLRIVRRDEMQLVASAHCATVQPAKPVRSGW